MLYPIELRTHSDLTRTACHNRGTGRKEMAQRGEWKTGHPFMEDENENEGD
jgi:hypothetical protein